MSQLVRLEGKHTTQNAHCASQNTNAHKRNTEQTKTKHKCQPTNMARLLWNK